MKKIEIQVLAMLLFSGVIGLIMEWLEIPHEPNAVLAFYFGAVTGAVGVLVVQFVPPTKRK